MPHISPHGSRVAPASSTDVVLREAKRLHRAATSDVLSDALPVLRRLLAAHVVAVHTLPLLYRARATVQRKHVLRMLAIEAGHGSWEKYSEALPQLDPQVLLQALASERNPATLKLWFASEAEATRYAARHGGRTTRIRKQAVVLPVES